MLSVRGIHSSYGRKIKALHGVSLEVGPGEIVCLIGANGAGKTTLLKTISGLLKPDAGEIYFDGSRVDSFPAHRTAGLGLVHVPEGRRIFPQLSVRENLEVGAFSRGNWKNRERDVERVCALFPVLGHRMGQEGGTLSGGEQQMLAMARALMAYPRLLMMDEPSMGLAPLVVQKIFSIIQEIHREGTPILLVEQNAQEALRVAHRGYVMETGHVVREGSAKDLITDRAVRAAYLGMT
ncbi:MAG: ABC transporter ATP-binding protein [Elusimicrobia bacterium]|nr:ABC transporter ATP-binding protein [Elusimicrobiota bacterium]